MDTDLPIASIKTSDYIRMIFIFIFVLVLLWFVLKFLKKMSGIRGLDDGQIEVLSTKALRGTAALHLVEVGAQVFLVGASESSVNLISEITDKDTVDGIRLKKETEKPVTKNFLQMFSENFATPLSREESQGFLKKQKNRLHKFKDQDNS